MPPSRLVRVVALFTFCLLCVARPVSAEPSFEITSDTAIKTGVKKTLQVDEVFQCLAACLEEESFECKSADYKPDTKRCRLSDGTGSPAAEVGTDYFLVTDDGNPRGRGKCSPGHVKSGALCYKPCPAGYVGRGPVCWEKCPKGYKNDGATCRKPVEIVKRDSKGRGAGKPLGCASNEEKDGALCYPRCKAGYNGVGPVCWEQCPNGYVNDGATCRDKGHVFGKKSYGRGVGKVAKKNCSGSCEKDAGLWYPKCRDGYNGRGPVCWQTCPSGYKNDGATCRRPVKIEAKKSYGRGAGRALHACAAGWEKDGGLCYPACPTGYAGVGPVCWKTCPSGFKTDGATCRKPGKIIAKKTTTRGAGHLPRANLRRIFYRYIRDHRNVNLPRAKPLRQSEKTFLSTFFPEAVIDDVRILEWDRRTGFGNYKAGATTYDNLIIVKKGHRTNELLKHELVHVCQYKKLGVEKFAHAYADQYIDSGYNDSRMAFEQDAYGYADRTEHIQQYLGADNTRGSIYATCK